MVNSKCFKMILFFLGFAAVASVLADEGASSLRESTQPEAARVSFSVDETQLSVSSSGKATNSPIIVVEGGPETARGCGFYLHVQDSCFIVAALHSFICSDGKTPVPLERISLMINGEIYAIDDGCGSLSRRRELERQGLVKKSTRVVRIIGRPLLCPNVDALVIKLAEQIPGHAPFVPSSASNPVVGDEAIIATCDGKNLECSIGDPNYVDKDGLPRLRLIAKEAVFENGQAGAPALDSTGAVIGALSKIKDKGVRRVGEDGDERIVSDDSLCVPLKDVLDVVYNRWNLTK